MPLAVQDGAETADRTSTSIRHGRTAPMASRPQCSRRRSAFFLSSRFDAREQSERCRLNCTRRAVQTDRIVRFEKQFENLRVLRVTVRSAVFSVSDVTSCKRSDGVVAGKDPARIQGTADVRTRDRTSPERPLSETFQVLGKGSRRLELSTAGIKFRPTISRPTQAGFRRSNLHFRQAVRVASIRVRLRFNLLRSVSFHASSLDARHETQRARLDTDSRTVKGGGARGINA